MVCSCPSDTSVPWYCTVFGALLVLSVGVGCFSCCSSAANFARSCSFWWSLRALSVVVSVLPTFGGPLSHLVAASGDPFPLPFHLRPQKSRAAKLFLPLPLPFGSGPVPCLGALHWVHTLEVTHRPVSPQELQVQVGLPCAAFGVGAIEPWCDCSWWTEW